MTIPIARSLRLMAVAVPAIAILAYGVGSALGTDKATTAAASGSSVIDGVHFVSVDALQSQVIGHRAAVLLFMAPGCSSCTAEVQALVGALSGSSKLQLVGIDMSPDDPRDLVPYLRAIQVADAPFIWTVDSNGTLTVRYQVTALSSTVGLDSSGRVRFTNQGPADDGELVKQVSQLA